MLGIMGKAPKNTDSYTSRIIRLVQRQVIIEFAVQVTKVTEVRESSYAQTYLFC